MGIATPIRLRDDFTNRLVVFAALRMQRPTTARIFYEENADMRARLIALLLLAASGLLSHTTASADIIRCNDTNGNTLFTDSACPAGMRAISVTSLPPPCASDDCERRRERDLKEAYERARAEKEQLASYSAERRKREIEDRWIDEDRYEAELRSSEASQVPAAEVVYPVVGFPLRCGTHCFPSRHHRPPQARIGDGGHSHHHAKTTEPRQAPARVARDEGRAARGKRASL